VGYLKRLFAQNFPAAADPGLVAEAEEPTSDEHRSGRSSYLETRKGPSPGDEVAPD